MGMPQSKAYILNPFASPYFGHDGQLMHEEQCHHITVITDHNVSWTLHIPEPCSKESCGHKRCKKCFDLDANNWHLQRCDGSDFITTPLWPELEEEGG